MLEDPKDKNIKSILILLHSLLRERNSAYSYRLVYLPIVVCLGGFIVPNCLIKTCLNTNNSNTLLSLTTCFPQHWWFRELTI